VPGVKRRELRDAEKIISGDSALADETRPVLEFVGVKFAIEVGYAKQETACASAMALL